MTENEAINVLKMIEAHGCLAIEAKEVAIQALEEIQQYRAIGTVEELKKIEESFNVISDKVWNYILAGEELLKRYEAIGTIEEFKNFKKKSVAKKPRFYAHNYYCIECGNLVGNNEFEWQRFLYCDKCGQKLDWQQKEKSMGVDKEWFEIIMKQVNGSLMTALENQIQADIGGTREEANRVANHILDILDIANENKEQEIRNKAIDEFASTLIPRLTDAIYQKDVESMTNLINEIAEHLKAGGENE